MPGAEQLQLLRAVSFAPLNARDRDAGNVAIREASEYGFRSILRDHALHDMNVALAEPGDGFTRAVNAVADARVIGHVIRPVAREQAADVDHNFFTALVNSSRSASPGVIGIITPGCIGSAGWR